RQRPSARSARSPRCPPLVSQTDSPREESHMFASSWLRQLQRRWFPRRTIRRASVRRVRLCLEALEDGTLLPNVATTGDLITAIQTANNNPGTPTTITLAANTTFDFTSADNATNGANALPVITGNITIVGNGDTLERSGT